MDLQRLQSQIGNTSLPPVEKWDPEFCGDIDLQIKHNGQWFYMGTPIGRMSLVKLFASVLKKEGDDYFLVTPVEKVGIRVEDVPFVITEWHQENSFLMMQTNVGDQAIVSEENPVLLLQDRVTNELLPYLNVRRNLFARLHQNVFYQLAEIAEIEIVEGQQQVVLNSGDYRFSLGFC